MKIIYEADDGTLEELNVDDIYYGSKDECLRYSIRYY